MSETEAVRLEREIAQRRERLNELRPPLTREDLQEMSTAEIAALSPSVVVMALERTRQLTREDLKAMSTEQIAQLPDDVVMGAMGRSREEATA